MRTFGRSWQLFKQTWAVINAEKGLILFPLLSALVATIVTVLVVLGIWIAFAVSPGLQQQATQAVDAAAAGEGSAVETIVGIAILFVYYLIVSLIATYFMTGLAGAALQAFEGKDTSFGEGMRIANSRLGTIFGFSLISATVGVILSLLSSREGNAGRVAGALGGAAWSIATFLAVPVIARKEVGAVDALKESGSLVTRTWGQQVVGRAGIGAVLGLIIFLAVLLFGFLTIWAFASVESATLGIVIGAIGLLIVVILALVNSSLNGIYKAAVYHYADAGKAPVQYNEELIASAFGAAPAKA
jgi:hypothetical protein